MTGLVHDDLGRVDRRPAVARIGRISLVTALALFVGMLSRFGVALAATGPDGLPATGPMSPEVKLVDDYNARILSRVGSGDVMRLKADLSPYITDKTVLHEPVSLPWGGTMIGFAGWARLVRISDPVFARIADRMEISPPEYYQTGNVVLHELTITFRAKKPGGPPYVTEIIEKYTIENGRIEQIDEFWEDTATLLKELTAMGAMAPGRP